jgi:hypothetical protein
VTIEDYIEKRNEIVFSAESVNKELADVVWTELGVANRHIERVIDGVYPLQFVEKEIDTCLFRMKSYIESCKSKLTVVPEQTHTSR